MYKVNMSTHENGRSTIEYDEERTKINAIQMIRKAFIEEHMTSAESRQRNYYWTDWN